jgi:hypothetical protein
MNENNANAWLEAVPKSQQNVLQALREAIISVGPEIVEEIKWRRPCYSTGDKLFCYLHSTKKHATLGFQMGRQLNDPDGLLEGDGKDMRYIKFTPGKEPNWSAITNLILEAYRKAT